MSNRNFIVDYYSITVDTVVLFGGRAAYWTLEPSNVGSYMRERMLGVFSYVKDVKIDYAWGGYIAITSTCIFRFRVSVAVVCSTRHWLLGARVVALARPVRKVRSSESIRGQGESLDSVSTNQGSAPWRCGPVRTSLVVASVLLYRLRGGRS